MIHRHALALAIVLAGMATVTTGQQKKEAPLFTAQQATQGKAIYASRCAMCHGETLQGGAAGSLVGPAFAASWSLGGLVGGWGDAQLTVDDLDFIIRTTMPKGSAGKLPADRFFGQRSIAGTAACWRRWGRTGFCEPSIGIITK